MAGSDLQINYLSLICLIMYYLLSLIVGKRVMMVPGSIKKKDFKIENTFLYKLDNSNTEKSCFQWLDLRQDWV